MQKLKIIVSDFHLGVGKYLPDGRFNYLEDFYYDDKFIEFLRYHRTGPFAEADIELIVNGDFFNHLQVNVDDPSPEIIDEEEAILRTKAILKGHPEMFSAMKEFADTPHHFITFTLGNHDPGLLFTAVHHLLQQTLGQKTEVKTGPYIFDGVHVEHGNQYFADNAYNTRLYFLSKGLPKPVVNIPWGSYFVIHFLNPIKKERHYFDKIYPFKYYLRWAFIHDTGFAIRSIAKILFYFFWLRFRKDPYRRSPLTRTLKIAKEVPLSPKLDREAKKILLSQKNIHTVVFSHTHFALLRQFTPNKTYINTGLWNEQISLEISNPGKIVRLTYAQLDYGEEGNIKPSLKEWKGTHQIIEDIF